MTTETKSTGRDSDKFMLRFPDGMRDRIAEAAKAAGRSMNAEINARLQASFDDSGADLTRMINAELTDATHSGEMLNARMDLVKSRLDALNQRIRIKGLEAEKLATTARTDNDFAELTDRINKEFDGLIADGEALKLEQEQLIGQRNAIVAKLSHLHHALTSKRSELETALAKKEPATPAKRQAKKP